MPVSQALPQTCYDPTGPAEPDRAAAPWHTLALHALTAPNWGYAGTGSLVVPCVGPTPQCVLSLDFWTGEARMWAGPGPSFGPW